MQDSINDYLKRIKTALEMAGTVAMNFMPQNTEVYLKPDKSIVTEADFAVDKILKEILPKGNEGWLSEETVDDESRLRQKCVWVVDPIDGTIEFANGIPHWTISVGMVIDGIPVAGGIINPKRRQLFLGALGHGITLNGNPASISNRTRIEGCKISVSNTEYRKGKWDEFQKLPVDILPMGSTAYKLARVAAGIDDISLSLGKKHEWDLAAGFCLVKAAGGVYLDRFGKQNLFNQKEVSHEGFIIGPECIVKEVLGMIND